MSLRDQLVAKGLVSKKDANRVNRELKEERRSEQGQRKRKSELEAEAREVARVAAEAQAEAVRARREALGERRAAEERELRIKHIVTGNALRPGAGQPFWHRSIDGKHLLRIDVSSGVAYQLRCGEAAIVAVVRPGWDTTYAIVDKDAALRLLALAPERVVFHVADTTGLGAPDLAFLRRDWEPSLAAHRVRPDDEAPR